MSGAKMKSPIFVALDVDTITVAKRLAEETAPYVGGFKIGPRLILRHGPEMIADFARLAPVFVDLKFHDIPSTVLSAVESTFVAGASFATVHASNGRDCLQELATLEKRLNEERPFRLLGVTVLTSFNEKSLPSNWRKESIAGHVEALAKDTVDSGVNGLVCSPHEVTSLRKAYKNAFLVTPGIRLPDGKGKDDQARTMTPAEALKAGASALVIGRPIVAASNPGKAAEAIAKSI